MKSKTKRFNKTDPVIMANSAMNPFYMNVDHSRIGLIIVHMNLQLILDLAKPILLGRDFSEVSTTHVGINLTPFDGESMGVSRRHAVLEIQDNRLVITDQQSSNGTLVNAKMIESLIPFVIMQGDLLKLGQMEILVSLLSAG